MNFFEQQGQRLIWRNYGETLILMPWGRNSLRVQSSFMREPEDTRWALLAPEETDVEIKTDVEIEIDGKGYKASIRNGNLLAEICVNDWTQYANINFYNQKGELLIGERDSGGALNTRARCFKPILGGDYRLTAAFVSDPFEKLYGMGQYQLEHLDLKGCSLELAHRNSQASVPFVLSSKGYGFLWHNPAVGRVNFSKNVTEWHAESTKQLDYWITAADNPADILRVYAEATGTVPMMPEYGLGFWQCKLRYWNQEQLLSVAREYKRRKLPIDVIVCDFFHWPKMGDFRVDEEFWPDLEGMVAELKEMGIELMVSVWPQIDLKSENFLEMRQKGYLIKPELGVNVCMQFGGDSVFLDATNPGARDYVWKKCKQNYYDKGVRVFWLDEAEPEYGVYDYENYRYSLGPNIQVGNIYPQMFSRAFYDGMREAGQENPVNLVRCAWAGSQRYGALVWSGDIHSDYKTFRRQVCAGINMGIAGIPWWTTDIGGFFGGNPDDEAFRELFIRWFQWGAFCPVMRLHGDRLPATKLFKKDGTPVQATGGNNEVWAFGDEAYPTLVKFMRLRELLRGYTREIMREAHQKGMPVMRAMFVSFPDDPKCWEMQDQYMYGPDLLVAPVLWEKAEKRDVYLPAGVQWTDAYTGEVFSGGQTVCAASPISQIPLFLRNGRQEYIIKFFNEQIKISDSGVVE